jgi:excisionase family DNA binding protein
MLADIEAGYIGVKELAARLAVSSRSVWRIIERGELNVTRIGRRTLLSRAEVARWLAGRQVSPPSQMTNAARQLAPR